MAIALTPMSLQDYGNAIAPGVRKAYFDTYKIEEPKLNLVATVSTLEDYNQLEVNFSDLGLFELTGEGEAYKEDAMLEGFTTTYTPLKYTKRVPITEELMIFDKQGITSKSTIGQAISRVTTATIEGGIASVYNNGFDTNFVSYSDGKPLFSSNHTRVDGGSAFSNVSTAGLPLTHDNLAFAITQMQKTLSDRGINSPLKARTLLVPPDLEALALEIVKSAGRSDTAERSDNVYGMTEYAGSGIKVVVWTYLTSSTAWFLIADKSPICWKWAIKPQLGTIDDTDENKNGTFAFSSKFMYAAGWGNPRGVYASKGDGLSYAG